MLGEMGGHQVKNGISAETLSKMSQSLKGMKAWNKGLKMYHSYWVYKCLIE